MNLRIALLIVLSIVLFKSYGQTDTVKTNSEHQFYEPSDRDKTSIGIITGWHQMKRGFGELGLGFAFSDFGRHGNMFHAVSLSVEFEPWRKVYGYKVSAWKSIPGFIPLSLGLNGVYYQKLSDHDVVIRPMLGFGVENFHLTYSVDIRLDKRDILERNAHMVSLRIFIPVIKIVPPNNF